MNADSGPDIWVPVVNEGRLEAVNADTGERRYGEEARRLVLPAPVLPWWKAWVPGCRAA